MKIEKIIWLDEIIEKLLVKHDVTQSEVIQVITGGPAFRFVENGFRKDEDIYSAMGRSVAGRFLAVFFVYKKGGVALIISARDMTKGERRKYEQK